MKALFKLIITLVVIYLVVFCIDYVRCSELKEPIFAYEINEDLYVGLGYGVKIKRDSNGSVDYLMMTGPNKTILEKGNVNKYKEKVENIVNNNLKNEVVENTIENKVENVVENVIENIVKPTIPSGKIQTVTINNGSIINEFLIDDFIENCEVGKKLSVQDNDKYILIEIITGKDISNTIGNDIYYRITLNGNVENARNISFNDWKVKKITNNNKVDVVFNSVINPDNKNIIFSYDLNKSDYKASIQVNFLERKEIGLKKIDKTKDLRKTKDSNIFNSYIYNGVVYVLEDGDMMVPIEDVIKKDTTYLTRLLEQAKVDSQYGICEKVEYDDGGSVEYLYDYYTIVKFNTLDGNNDLVIGPKGPIIGSIKNAYKDLEQ